MNSRNVNNQLDALDYRYNMVQRDACAMRSRTALQNKDVGMFHFWTNASRAFERRALDENDTERVERLTKEVRLTWSKENVPAGYFLCDGSEHSYSEVKNV